MFQQWISICHAETNAVYYLTCNDYIIVLQRNKTNFTLKEQLYFPFYSKAHSTIIPRIRSNSKAAFTCSDVQIVQCRRSSIITPGYVLWSITGKRNFALASLLLCPRARILLQQWPGNNAPLSLLLLPDKYCGGAKIYQDL